MAACLEYRLLELTPDDTARMEALLGVFGEAFEDPETYGARRPGSAYLRKLLGSETFVALAAIAGAEVIGGLAAYLLPKFEQERSELYIYDLAVAAKHRRKGVATALIGRLKQIAAERGVYVIYVQADFGDAPAIALYSKLGLREDVLHFDIEVGSETA